MKRFTIFFLITFLFTFLSSALAAKGGGGRGSGTIGGGSSTGGGGGGGGQPPTDLEGPLNDKMSDQGTLFGDLFVILRYQGGEEKSSTVNAIGGEPILTEDYAWYIEIDEESGETGETLQALSPSLCVQPVASYLRWGDIHQGEGDLLDNQIPLVKTYDPTWGRTECDVGLPDDEDGDGIPDFDTSGEPVVEPYFIQPGGSWTDPVNGSVTYENGVLWTELIQDVHFGRLNIARSPEAVLQSSFDEAISTINQALKIELDSSGRLLLTRTSESELYVDLETGLPNPTYTVEFEKAIDSPLENLSLYVKLLKDGHLVTPAVEREPIDRSLNGGIPLSKLVELADGPSKELRPTIDIAKLREWGMGNLVDVDEVVYYTYYDISYTDDCTATERTLVTSDVSCEVLGIEEVDSCGNAILCSGPYIGILTDTGSTPTGEDFLAAASFFASAADKTGYLTADMIVYLNSILGLNLVVGYSETDEEGLPIAGATDYSTNPEYFDFSEVEPYDRDTIYKNRGEVEDEGTGGDGDPSTYTGYAWLLFEEAPDPYDTEAPPSWNETLLELLDEDNVDFGPVAIGWDDGDNLLIEDRTINIIGANDILGFTQMAEDALRVIDFIHTYQIPDRR